MRLDMGRFCPLSRDVQTLEPPDSHHLNHAIGWLGLGCVVDARAELAQISPEWQEHPEVLEVRWMLLAQEKQWDEALTVARREMVVMPEESSGWLHCAYALRRIADGGLAQAWDALLPAVKLFPQEPVIPYNLACYACQLERMADAWQWFQRALKVGNKASLKQMALADPDLKPLWTQIAAM